jgi:arylsulfatase A-like enzyme
LSFVILPVIFAFMPAPHILVVIVDGLRASALGAYGNTSFSTPALDRFAAQSFLLDWCYSPSTDLSDIYRALWRPGENSLPHRLHSLGYTTELVTDDPTVTSLPAACDFDHCLQLNTVADEAEVTARSSDISGTLLARLFAVAGNAVASATTESPKLIWLHSRGMYGPWDAPLELQQSLLDESDPPPLEDVRPPDFVAGADDPDAAFCYGCAYAAQVMVLDDYWEALLASIDATGVMRKWIVTLLGARGYPLGEHRRVGGVDPRLYGEQLHVPWLVRFPDATGQLGRSGQLTTHDDLAASLVDSIEGSNVRALATAARQSWRDALIATGAAHRAIRTGDWCLRQNRCRRIDESAIPQDDALSPDVELFVRPDDRWEANNVAKLCPDVVDSLMGKLDAMLRCS